MVPTDKQTMLSTDVSWDSSKFITFEPLLWTRVTLVKASRTVKQIVLMHRQLTMNRTEKSPNVNEDLINVPI